MSARRAGGESPQLALLDTTALHDARPAPRRVVVSYGLGADSTALLLRWLHEPASRTFALSDLLVVTAMTGDEWDITGRLVTKHILPRLAHAGVRFVQLARAGPSQRDGIVVLDDSRAPTRLYLEGRYKLSQELTAAGTVPQTGGPRRCSIKAKGWPLDTFLAGEFGASAYRHAIGFEAAELGRARRDARCGSSWRRPEYPLIEWGWDREDCESYIASHTGVAVWPKSACVYCPFALTNKAGLERTIAAYLDDARAAIAALLLERRSIALNSAQGLIAGRRLWDVLAERGHRMLLDVAEEHLDATPHTLYEVRRLVRPTAHDVTKRANASRDLRILDRGSRAAMGRALRGAATRRGLCIDTSDDVPRAWIEHRGATLPAREHLLVAAPTGAVEKGDARFDRWWAAASRAPRAAAA
jgi:hypothetical protein